LFGMAACSCFTLPPAVCGLVVLDGVSYDLPVAGGAAARLGLVLAGLGADGSECEDAEVLLAALDDDRVCGCDRGNLERVWVLSLIGDLLGAETGDPDCWS
jgi:hypothetical protein